MCKKTQKEICPIKKKDKNKCPFLKNLLKNFEKSVKISVQTEMQ